MAEWGERWGREGGGGGGVQEPSLGNLIVKCFPMHIHPSAQDTAKCIIIKLIQIIIIYVFIYAKCISMCVLRM